MGQRNSQERPLSNQNNPSRFLRNGGGAWYRLRMFSDPVLHSELSNESQPGKSVSSPIGFSAVALRSGMQVWSEDCVEDALQAVAEKSIALQTSSGLPSNQKESEDRSKRYELLDLLLNGHVMCDGRSGREVVGWIVAGYLSEFVRQTLNKLPPLNIANPQRPQAVAKAYWDGVPQELFEREISPGVRHTALAYHLLQEEHFRLNGNEGTKTGRKAAWDAASELLRASIDTYRVRGREIFPDEPLRASVYNDHLHVIEFARRTFCSIAPAAKVAA